LYHAAFIRPNRYPEVWLKFSVNPTRFDPHKNFKFRIKWDGRYVAGVSKISGLRRTTEVIQHREGGDPSTSRKSPGHTEFAPITLERGVTHDPEFENWANKVWSLGAGRGAEVSLKDFRKDVVLELLMRLDNSCSLISLSLLGCGIQNPAQPGRQRECDRYRAYQVGKRRLGTRSINKGAGRAVFKEIVTGSACRLV